MFRHTFSNLKVYRSSHKNRCPSIPVTELKSSQSSLFMCSASENQETFLQKIAESEHLMFEITGVEEMCIYANRSQWLGLTGRNKGISF